MKNKTTPFRLALAFVAMLFFAMANGQIYVSSSIGNDGTGDGSYGNPYLTLNYVIQISNPGDSIVLMDGTYNLASPIDTIKHELIIRSENGPQNCAVIGDGVNHVFHIWGNIYTRIEGIDISNGYNGVFVEGAYPEIQNCRIHHNSQMGIYADTNRLLGYASFIDVHHNLIDHNGWDGIQSFEGGMATIYNNTVVSNANAGIQVAFGTDDIRNNIVYANSYGIQDAGGGSPAKTIMNNLAFGNSTMDMDVVGDMNTVYADPMFNDTTNYDFSLQPGSQAIDAGDNYFISMDPDGTTPDIGAFYFHQGTAGLNINVYPESSTCAPATFIFENNSNIDTVGMNYGPLSFEWRIDGNPFSSDSIPLNKAFMPGSHHIEFLVYGQFVGLIGGTSQMINVDGGPQVFWPKNNAQVCPGSMANFNLNFFNIIEEEVYNYQWFVDGAEITDAYEPYFSTNLSDGIHTIKVKYEHSICGMDSIQQNINVTPNASPDIFIESNVTGRLCNGDLATFELNDPGLINIVWKVDNIEVGTGSKLSYKFDGYSNGATVSVDATAESQCGGSNTDAYIINIANDVYPGAGFSWDMNGAICPNTPVKFSAHSPGVNYQWLIDGNPVSNEPMPVLEFPSMDYFDVTLIVENGCAEKDTSTQNIDLMNPPQVFGDISYDVFHNNEFVDYYSGDTLRFCPGVDLRFESRNFWQDGFNFIWVKYNETTYQEDTIFGSNVNINFMEEGIYTIYHSAINNCMQSIESYDNITIEVSNAVMPKTDFDYLPKVMCADEQVYFFDNEYPEETGYVYDFDFGDGTTLMGVDQVSTEFEVLALHTYTNAQSSYAFTVTVTNQCGNSIYITDTVKITTDQSKMPFYYVSNSSGADNEPNMDGPPQDWSVSVNSSQEHTLLMPFKWMNWTYMDTMVFWFWYGNVDIMNGDAGSPSGYVAYESASITTGDVATAYIPVNPMLPQEVTVVAGWYCDGNFFNGGEPTVYGMALAADTTPVNAFPITPGATTNVTATAALGFEIFDLSPATCDPNINGSYLADMGSYFIYLDIWDNQGSLEYNIHQSTTMDDLYQSYISGGVAYDSSEISRIEFYDNTGSGCDGISGFYDYSTDGDSIYFNTFTESCTERANFLGGITFHRFEMSNNTGNGDYMNEGACPNDVVHFSVAGGASHTWVFPDGSQIQGSIVSYQFTDTGKYEVKLIAQNNCGRIDTLYSPVNVLEHKYIDAYFYSNKVVAGKSEQVYFFPNQDDDELENITLEWNFGDGSPAEISDIGVHEYTRAGRYMVTLRATNNCGDEAIQSQQIEIIDAFNTCNLESGFVITEIQAGEYSFINQSITSSGVEYFWSISDGREFNTKDVSSVLLADGKYEVCLTVYDPSTNCIHTYCEELIVGTLNCLASFDYTVDVVNKKVTFTYTGTAATDYFWEFGDGVSSIAQSPTHIYDYTGTYVVFLNVYDSNKDCYDEVKMEIQVGEQSANALFADFTFFVQNDSTVSFTNISKGTPTGVMWVFGDGTFSTEANPVHVYKYKGSYNTTLTIFDDVLGIQAVKSLQVIVGAQSCSVMADFNRLIDDATKTVRFTDKSTGAVDKWFWNFGNGKTSSLKSPVITYTNPGFYLVSLSAKNSLNGCTDFYSEIIKVGASQCRANFQYTVNADTRTVKFVNNSVATNGKYYWNFDDGSFSTDSVPTHVYAKPGLYQVSLTVSSATCSDFISIPIQVGTVDCDADFSFYVDETTLDVEFTSKSLGGATGFFWVFGDGAISEEMNPTHKFTHPGYYKVTLNTLNNAGCLDNMDKTILVGSEGEDCQADFIYSADESFNVNFTDRSAGDVNTYLWNMGDGTFSTEANPTHTYVDGGYYNVCLTVVNSLGKKNTFCKYVAVVPKDADNCLSQFTAMVDKTTKTVRLLDKSVGTPNSWAWDLGDNSTATVQSPTHTYADAGLYIVSLDISNQYNCTNASYKLINVASAETGIQAAFIFEEKGTGTKADGYPVDFIGVSLGESSNLKWTADGETIDTTSNETTATLQGGTHEVCYEVTDPITGLTDKYCQQVTVGANGVEETALTDGLLTNYPNPFADATTIAFNMHKEAMVNLSVFDMAGKKVETIINTTKTAGSHKILWNSGSLSPGMYYLKLTTEDDQIVKQMIIQ